ncbi:PKD domain-containing protein [bacterium]|nr:PKD domain-containing protein [bacterium]
MPALSELRSTQAAGDHTVLASAFDAISPGVVKEGNFPLEVLRMDASDGGGFEWAVFSFDAAATGEELLDVAVTMASENGSIDPAFAAVSDFSNGRWRVVGPFSSATAPADFTFELNSATDLSPEGRVFVAVISPVGSELLVGLLNFRTLALQNPAADIQADLTSGEAPLTVNFDASASADSDGEIVLYEWDVAGDGNFEASTGLSPAHQISYSNGGIFNATVRVTDNDGLSSTAAIEITVTEGGNIPPQAVLESDVLDGEAEPGFSVNFSADQSSDSDGSITLYEWDLDSDTTTGTNGFELSSATPDPQQVTYNSPGEFLVRLRVTDDGGIRRVDTQRIVSHGWIQVPIDQIGNNQKASGFSLRVIGKFPALSYRDGELADLIYARSSTTFGAAPADWSLTAVTSMGATVNTALCEVADRPAIAFNNESGLIYTRSTTASGADPADWETIKADGESGTGVALEVVNGFPAISYRAGGAVPHKIKYVHSDEATGIDNEGWLSVLLEQGGSFSPSTDLTVVEGNPAVAWIAGTPGGNELKYARSATADGGDSADWSAVLAGELAAPSQRLGLTVVEGNPALCFGSTLSGGLRQGFVRSSSSLGQSGADWSPFELDSANGTGSFSSIAVVSGAPMVLYDDGDQPNSLRLAVSSSASGSVLADWQIEDAMAEGEGIETTARDLEITEVDGFAAIVFFNSITDEVTYAIRF